MHTSIQEAIQPSHKITLWSVASPVHRNCQAIHCTVLNTKAPGILFLLCLHVISTVQIFPGSHAVRSLSSRKGSASLAFYDVGKI